MAEATKRCACRLVGVQFSTKPIGHNPLWGLIDGHSCVHYFAWEFFECLPSLSRWVRLAGFVRCHLLVGETLLWRFYGRHFFISESGHY